MYGEVFHRILSLSLLLILRDTIEYMRYEVRYEALQMYNLISKPSLNKVTRCITVVYFVGQMDFSALKLTGKLKKVRKNNYW